MATVWIDGKDCSVDASKNLLQVALELGFRLPYFCWHPALGSVGACRQCAVKQYKDENDTKGKLVMACMTPAADGTRIELDESEAEEFRRSIVEWLMINHPHDCPICDEGGECHLQDMTVMAGHAYRRYRFKKRTYRNQYLGPFINHEMNRCIQCYRCVRFYGDYAGGRDLKAFAAHDHVYFGRDRDGQLESEFSGNLVEVCPTGVFTDKTLKDHYTRKWDLQTAPSVCGHCSLGCNITPGERDGTVRRVRARYNDAVNGHFICDRGRFGYGFVNDERRLTAALVPHTTAHPAEALDEHAAVERFVDILSKARGVVAVGSPRRSVEDNFVLRALVGPEHFHQPASAAGAQRLERIRDILDQGPARSPSLRETEQADAVLVLGEDVTDTAPMLALALRQAARVAPKRGAAALKIPAWHDAAVREVIQNDTGPVFLVTPAQTKLDDIALEAHHADPDQIARLGFAVAHALDDSAPAVPDLSEGERELSRRIATALANAERPLVVAGTSLDSDAVIEAAANVAWACRASSGQSAALTYVVPECNSLAMPLLGAKDLDTAVDALAGGQADTAIVLDAELLSRADPRQVECLLRSAAQTVVLDATAHDAASQASLVLPLATSFEGHGTFINNEGRAQRYFQVFEPAGDMWDGWRWLSEVRRKVFPGEVAWQRLTDVHRAMAEQVPLLSGVGKASPPPDLRAAGLPIARQLPRYSGRTAMRVHLQIHEQPPPDDPDSPLRFSMEGAGANAPGRLVGEFWSPGFNSIQALHRFQEEIEGPLRGGNGGTRLIEPAPDARPTYFDAIPPPDVPSSRRRGTAQFPEAPAPSSSGRAAR